MTVKIDPREEAIRQIKERYKTLKGAGFNPEAVPKQEEKTATTTTSQKKTTDVITFKQRAKNPITPYLMLIENDIRKVLRLPPKELKMKPVDLKWLEEKRRFF